MPYPPSTGAYAVYSQEDFYEHVDFALDRVSDVTFFGPILFMWVYCSNCNDYVDNSFTYVYACVI